jgi:hypothetical protein
MIASSVSEGSEAFSEPSSDPCHVAAGSCHQVPRFPRFEVFEMRRLRIDEQACRDSEGGAFRGVG